VSASAVTIGFAPELLVKICLKAIDTFRLTAKPLSQSGNGLRMIHEKGDFNHAPPLLSRVEPLGGLAFSCREHALLGSEARGWTG
jgi:hypothetical protein